MKVSNSELNPKNWSKSNSWGFTIFSKEIQIAAVEEFLSGVSQSIIRRKYRIKGSATLYNWVECIKNQGSVAVKDMKRSKTNYQYPFKIKVIRWRIENKASFPITAKKFQIRNPFLDLAMGTCSSIRPAKTG